MAQRYNVVSYCRLCKKRMVAPRGEDRRYCPDCQKRMDKSREEEAAREAEEEKGKK
ncbi:hypothetical protein KY327_01960 [Candidatus Woesearchaeota archaeon]|nr:hypothetical protein [Candidatus Woesearchaeota archaeon]